MLTFGALTGEREPLKDGRTSVPHEQNYKTNSSKSVK